MASLMIVQNFNFPGDIARKSALDWSADDRIAVCTKRGIYIFSSYFSPIETGFPLPLHKQVIPAPTEYLDFGLSFNAPVINFGISCPEPFQEVYMDHTLSSPKDPHFLSYKSIAWSPKGIHTDGSACLLATLTVDHRLVLHEERDREWVAVCDVSQLLINIRRAEWNNPDSESEEEEEEEDNDTEEQSPNQKPPIDSSMSLSKITRMKEKAFNLATMEMTWSHVFTSAPSLHDLGSRWSYLIVSMKSGHIIFWKVSPDDPGMVTLAYDFEPKLHLVTTMRWQQTTTQSGFLVIGTIMGTVNILPVFVHEDDKKLTLKPMCKLWADADRIVADHIVILKSGLKKHVVVVAKQNFLIFCEVHVSDADILINNIGHSTGLHRLPVTGLSIMGNAMPQNQLLLSSMEGKIINVKITSGLRGISLSHNPLTLDVDLKHNTIQGVGVSSNAAIAAAIINTTAHFDHLIKREPLQFVMFITRPLEEIFSEFSKVLKPQITFLPPAAAGDISQYTDFLECARIHLANYEDVPELFSTLVNWKIESYERLNSTELYLLRFLLKCFLSGLAVNVPFDSIDLTSRLFVVENIIVQNYISKVVRSCHDKIPLLSPAQGQSLLLMADWLYMQFQTPISNLYEAFGHDCPPDTASIPPREICRVCSLPVKLEDFRFGECEKKHKFARCCQSLILCDVTPYYQCLSCKSVAMEDVWSNKFICTYCSFPMTR